MQSKFRILSSKSFVYKVKKRSILLITTYQTVGKSVAERTLYCREEENLVFCFGALFNSTLNFTQSG